MSDHELRLKIDASAAKRGSREFTAAIRAISAAVTSLDRDAAGVFTKLKSLNPKVDVSGLRQASAETQKVERSASTAEAAQRRLALSISSGMRVAQNDVGRLTKRLDKVGDTSSIDRLDAAYNKLTASMVKANSPLDVRSARDQYANAAHAIKQQTAALESQQKAEATAAASASAHARQLEALRGKYNPLYTASKQYERALSEISMAEREGVITSAQAANARATAAQQLANAGQQMNAFGQATQTSGFHTANIAAQFNDIGVMMASGQSPFILALQQGTQLNQVFTQMGGGVKGVAAGMKSALMSVVSPLSLLTIGVVAGVAALGQWGISALQAGRETRSFEEAIGDAVTATNNLQSRSNTSISSIREQYGFLNDDLRTHLNLLTEIERRTALTEARATVEALMNDMNSWRSTATGTLQSMFDVNIGQANILQRRLTDIRDARTFDAMLAATVVMRTEILRLTGGLENMNDEQVTFLNNLTQIADNLMLAREAADDVEDGIGGAASAAETATTAADMLNQALATGASLSAQMLANLSSVPAAIGMMQAGVNAQLETIANQNAVLQIQLDTGVHSMVAERQFQLQQLVEQAASGTGNVNVDQIANLSMEIDQMQGLLAQQEALRTAITDANSPDSSGGGGSGAADIAAQRLEDLNNRLQQLQAQAVSIDLLASGVVATSEAADLLAEAMIQGGGAVDQQTMAILRQIDAAALLNEQLTTLAQDPVREWMDSVPSWIEAGQQIEMGAVKSLRDAFAEFFKSGEFDAQAMVDGILGSIAEMMADQTVNWLLNAFNRGEGGGLGALFAGNENQGLGTGSQAAGATIHRSMVAAGNQAAQAMANAMNQAGRVAGSQVHNAHTQGSASIRQAGSLHASRVQQSTTVGGAIHARNVHTAIQTGGTEHASKVRAASAGGGGGGLLSLLGIASGFFEEGGYSNSPVKSSIIPISAFANAPHYAEGTANTSGGMPAILHPDEAVIPLSRGRKVPIEMPKQNPAIADPSSPVTNNTSSRRVEYQDNTQINITVEGGGDDETSEEQANLIAEKLREELDARMDLKIVEAANYGGVLNNRGGGGMWR